MRNLSSQCSSLSCDSSTAPTGAPASVTETTVTSNSVTVQWEEVPCLDRNGEITGYQVVTANSQGMTVGTADVDVANRQATISGLTPSTTYTVSVAAVNGAGTGPIKTIAVETTGEIVVVLLPTKNFSLQTDGLSISVGSSSTTSITILWSLVEGVTATDYTISYSNTDTDCFSDSRSGISASGTSHTLTDLEEATEYSITVTASLTAGGTEMASITANTITDSQCILFSLNYIM